MKKFALFMMMASVIIACGSKNQADTEDEEEEVALTAEDSVAIMLALDDSIAAEIASLMMPYAAPEAPLEGADEYDIVAYEEARAAFDAAIEQYCHDTAAIYASREARLAANFAAALDAKKCEMKDNDDEEDDDED